MLKTTTMTVRLTPELCGKLERWRATPNYLAGEAIVSCVEMNAWQLARIKQALAEARSGAPGVSHAEVVRWVESWDTASQRRKPKPRQ